MRALLLEAIHDDAAFALRDAGFDVDRHDRALGEAELREALQGVHVLGLRSNTTLTASVLATVNRITVAIAGVDVPPCATTHAAIAPSGIDHSQASRPRR